MHVARMLVRWWVRRVALRSLEGRPWDRVDAERGRLRREDVRRVLKDAEAELDRLLTEANLESLPTRGSRHNVVLALYTIAAHNSLVRSGVDREYAAELVADVGWLMYSRPVAVLKVFARLRHRDPQQRLEFVLRLLMVYPFSAPGRPGYEVKAWREPNRYCTFWTHCPPLQAVRDHVQRHGDNGELNAFRQSWCKYDWALADLLADGPRGTAGSYERPHTMSEGDAVCDMSWVAMSPDDSTTDSDTRRRGS